MGGQLFILHSQGMQVYSQSSYTAESSVLRGTDGTRQKMEKGTKALVQAINSFYVIVSAEYHLKDQFFSIFMLKWAFLRFVRDTEQ